MIAFAYRATGAAHAEPIDPPCLTHWRHVVDNSCRDIVNRGEDTARVCRVLASVSAQSMNAPPSTGSATPVM